MLVTVSKYLTGTTWYIQHSKYSGVIKLSTKI